MRINLGCGMTPTPGWLNFDNSVSVRLARYPRVVASLLAATGFLKPAQIAFIDFCRRNDVRLANAVRRIPVADASADVIYSSHMVEHLDREEARAFLAEARRALRPGGTLRLAIPDLERRIEAYNRSRDADAFMASLNVCHGRSRTLAARLKDMLLGARRHNWMYDARSLCLLLTQSGFANAAPFPPGGTSLADPGPLNLREREDESIYVEARKP